MDPPDLDRVARMRWGVALTLTALVLLTYFGFILLVAFDKPLLGRVIAPGLSVGIALGAGVIVIAWVLTGVYVRWANTRYDAALHRLAAMRGDRR